MQVLGKVVLRMFTTVTERYSVAALFGCQLAAPVDKMGRRPQGYVGGRLLPCSAQARARKDSLKCFDPQPTGCLCGCSCE